MCHSAPLPAKKTLPRWSLGLLLAAVPALAQQPADDNPGLRPSWRKIGNTAVETGLASPVTGPVDRAWFSEDGGTLLVRTSTGRTYATRDLETWQAVSDSAPVDEPPSPVLAFPLESPEGLRTVRSAPSRLYALGAHVFRSDDAGRHWLNLTRFRESSIIGAEMRDLAVSPANPDEIVVANDSGVWRSADGGLSWSGLNQDLPNLPVRRLLASPAGTRGVALLLDGLGIVEWAPGEKLAWHRAEHPALIAEQAALLLARNRLGPEVTAASIAGDLLYAGASDGRIWVSSDQGQTWRLSRPAGPGTVRSFHIDAREPRIALAALAATAGEESPRVLRTINGGIFWDDITPGLPDGNVNGLFADPSTGAIYAATDRGVYLSFADRYAPSPAAAWMPLRGNLPDAPAMDVSLDAGGNQLYVAIEGHGVFAAPAPHRFRNPQVVSAADFSQRPAAPGSLLTVLGARVLRAQAGVLDVPVLHSSELESQIQVPFETREPRTLLSLDGARSLTFELPVQPVSPAIFIDPDGTPLLLDGDSGLLLDALNPARSHSRVQVLATGLGRVRPDWPTGLAAPLQDPPRVVAPVEAWLDREPVEVTRAILAPGFVGFYLVEVQLPSITNYGPAELYIQAGGLASNRVRIYIEP